MVLHAELDLYGCVIRSESVTRQSLSLLPSYYCSTLAKIAEFNQLGNQGKPISLSIKCYVRLS